MPVATYLASRNGRVGRILTGSLMAIIGVVVTGMSGHAASVWTLLVIMLGAEIGVGGALNVCVLCPLLGLPFQGRKLS